MSDEEEKITVPEVEVVGEPAAQPIATEEVAGAPAVCPVAPEGDPNEEACEGCA